MKSFDLPQLDLSQLQETLFSEKNWSKNEWPELLGIEYSDDGSDDLKNEDQTIVEISCFIPQTLSWFEGHYPDQPVLPGVVQTYWVTELSQILFQTSEFKGINALKFINMIMPETPLKLILKFTKETNSVAFTYVNESGSEVIKCSTGKVVFAQ